MDRSEIMRRVKSRDTGPEKIVRRALRTIGQTGYRLNRRDLPGRPDIAFLGRKRAIFVHGCFWHGHDCRRGARTPKTNTEYWKQKIVRNQVRDLSHEDELIAAGWDVLVIWECELRNAKRLQGRLAEFMAACRGH